jgi:hypothetical protein
MHPVSFLCKIEATFAIFLTSLKHKFFLKQKFCKQIFTTYKVLHEDAANLSSYILSTLGDFSDKTHTPWQHGHVKTVWFSSIHEGIYASTHTVQINHLLYLLIYHTPSINLCKVSHIQCSCQIYVTIKIKVFVSLKESLLCFVTSQLCLLLCTYMYHVTNDGYFVLVSTGQEAGTIINWQWTILFQSPSFH